MIEAPGVSDAGRFSFHDGIMVMAELQLLFGRMELCRASPVNRVRRQQAEEHGHAPVDDPHPWCCRVLTRSSGDRSNAVQMPSATTDDHRY